MWFYHIFETQIIFSHHNSEYSSLLYDEGSLWVPRTASPDHVVKFEMLNSVAFPQIWLHTHAIMVIVTQNLEQQSHGMTHYSRVCVSLNTKLTTYLHATATLSLPIVWTGSVMVDQWVGTWLMWQLWYFLRDNGLTACRLYDRFSHSCSCSAQVY